jgi:P4 family phage/plasmid primase-like protien
MYESGFTDLIPVIPPGASLAPSSAIPPGSVGKIPGRRLENGLWVGMNWRKTKASIDDIRTWQRWGANCGLRSDSFPAVDIDCADPTLAQIIEDAALAQLGPAPVRVGNPPKRLLPYRTAAPFGRMRLWMRKNDQHYLVEVLGQGTQYLVSGIHPTTQRAYEWSRDPAAIGAAGLTEITLEKAAAFLTYMEQTAEMLGYICEREGTGKREAERKGDQTAFLAPSLDELRQVVELLPNTSTLFPSRTDWLKVGYAIRAAAGEDNEPEAFNLFALWSAKWEGDDRSPLGNDPDKTREEWRRIKGPFSVGWSWLAEMARPYGFNDADFPVEEAAPTPAEDVRAPFLSDQWLALEVVKYSHMYLRYVPMLEKWLVWNRGRWQPDAAMLAEDTIKIELRKIAQKYNGAGASDKEAAAMMKEAKIIASAGKAAAVKQLVQSDRAIAVHPDSLDFDPWLLNTPGGIVDLRTGKMSSPDPDQLMTKSTSVTPDFNGPTPLWTKFLQEATGGDVQLQQYLQRLGGYALTGSTREQQYTFIYGPGGNGKGVFLNTLTGILGDYARQAPMDTFIASNNEKHATDLAMLQGARLVAASETQAGKRWDEAKLKSMTGGDRITARFMRQDFFTYEPQFKLVFIGNYKPVISNLDDAMRRRTHLVPFTVKPAVIDKELASKLKAEWPAILAWLIQGCLEWQQDGLNAPEIVLDATEEYFSDSDPVGQWIDESCTVGGDGWTPLIDLWNSWVEWTNGRGEYKGKIQRLGQMLEAKKFEKRKGGTSRRVEFFGIKVANRTDPLEAAGV